MPHHYMRNLLTWVPKSAQPWVATLTRAIFDQPADDEIHAQHAGVVASLEARPPDAAEHLVQAKPDLLAFTVFPRQLWRQIWCNNPKERLNKEIRRHTDVPGIPRPARDRPPGRRGPDGTDRRVDRGPR